MERIASLHEVDWIGAAMAPRSPPETTVANCVPPIFPAYAKIFHPIFEDLSVLDRKLSWDEWERRCFADSAEHPERRYEIMYAEADAQAQLQRVSWTTLAERYGLLYTPTLNASSFSHRFPDRLWLRYLFGPADGRLDDATRDALAEVLARHHGEGEDCFFHFWILATKQWETDLLYRGPLREVAQFQDNFEEVRLTPTHWFPPDRRWLVCTDYDLSFTLVGGAEALIADLLGSDRLECVRVRPDTRVDDKADVPNLPVVQSRYWFPRE